MTVQNRKFETCLKLQKRRVQTKSVIIKEMSTAREKPYTLYTEGALTAVPAC